MSLFIKNGVQPPRVMVRDIPVSHLFMWGGQVYMITDRGQMCLNTGCTTCWSQDLMVTPVKGTLILESPDLKPQGPSPRPCPEGF